VTVGCERILRFQTLHDDETDAIPAVSMNTSTAAIENAVNILVPCFAFWTGSCPPTDRQEGIVIWIGRWGSGQGLESRDRSPPMRQDESLWSMVTVILS
jgi:hypothetical protein